MTFGTIGSLNLSHDIDVIITKSPGVSTASFFKEVHQLFESLNEYALKQFKIRVINFARLTDEPFIKSSVLLSDNIMFHTMAYVSLPQMEMDWAWSLTPDDNFRQILKQSYSCIKGNVDMLFSSSFSKRNYYDNVVTYLYLNDIFNSGYDSKVVISVMQHLYDYLYRKRLNAKTPTIRNISDAKKYFYELCSLMDKMNKEKSN